MRGLRVLSLYAVLFTSLLTPVRAAEIVEGRPGVEEPFLYAEAEQPVASVILLAGGNGRLGLTKPSDNNSKNNNFLVRNRGLFQAQGFNIATVDAPADHRDKDGLSGPFRISAEHARDLEAVTAFLRAKANLPVFLVGTSRGSISAANAAARQKDGTYAGVVLTSAVTSTTKNEPVSISGATLDALRLPVLIVYHKDDRCVVSRPTGVPGLVEALSGATSIKTIEIVGGKPKEGPDCEPFAPHGYYGKEQETVEAVASWIKGTLK